MADPVLQFQGSLLGCAIGDALGAPYEGLWADIIPQREVLLSEFGEFEGYPLGQYTDDTQLTLATVKGILASGEVDPASIAREIGELWRFATVIGPGGACMEAGDTYLRTGDWATCGAPEGRAGNGTAMRTGFLGLCFGGDRDDLLSGVADICRITHRDSRSVAGGVGVAQLTQSLVRNPERSVGEHIACVSHSMAGFHQAFADQVLGLADLIGVDRREVARQIAWADASDIEMDQPIITPYIVPTVLASLWSILSFPDSWDKAVYNAIAFGGDVDTLGAIVGAVMGAKLGVEALPTRLVETVQDADEIRVLASRMSDHFPS